MSEIMMAVQGIVILVAIAGVAATVWSMRRDERRWSTWRRGSDR